MKISFDKDTDSLYIWFQEKKGHDVIVVNDDINVDIDEQGKPVGIEIHNGVSKYIDLGKIELEPAISAK
jgi:uncharacterized protein YuzE